MTFELNTIVPWGRTFQEYVAMFSLTERELSERILGCGDGPTSFNAELSRLGGSVVSVDPFYALNANEIRHRIDETLGIIMNQTRANSNEFIWQHIRSIDELSELRATAMREFLADYEEGRKEKRYLAQAAPYFDFPDNSFDLALSSHFLFLYSDHLNISFHIETLTELCRICGEVRVFPLLKLGAVISPFVRPVTEHFRSHGYDVSISRVQYEFQRGGNEMLEAIRKL